LTLVEIIVVVVLEMELEGRLERVATLHLHGGRERASSDRSTRTQPWGSVRIEPKVHWHPVWEQQEYLARLADSVERNHQLVQKSAPRLELIHPNPVLEVAACQENAEIYPLEESGDLKDWQGAHGRPLGVEYRVPEGLDQGRQRGLKPLIKMKLV
jgi:hypothetical protein